MTIKTVASMDEHEEQSYIVSWCRQNNIVAVAIPNGFNLNAHTQTLLSLGVSKSEIAKRNAISIKRERKQGMMTGAPDLILFSDKKMLFVENKVKNNKPSAIQICCHEWLRKLGYTVIVTKNTIDAIQQIKNFFGENYNDNPICEKYMEERKKVYENSRRSAN